MQTDPEDIPEYQKSFKEIDADIRFYREALETALSTICCRNSLPVDPRHCPPILRQEIVDSLNSALTINEAKQFGMTTAIASMKLLVYVSKNASLKRLFADVNLYNATGAKLAVLGEIIDSFFEIYKDHFDKNQHTELRYFTSSIILRRQVYDSSFDLWLNR